MSNNIAVSVTADVADLQAKRAILSAELKTAQKDLNDFAKAAASSGKTATLSKDMLASADAVSKLKVQLSNVDSGLKAHEVHLGSTREAYEGLRVVQEALTGNFERAGEGVVKMTEKFAAHSAEARELIETALPLGLTFGALVAGLGYLVAEEVKHEQAAAATAAAFALTGRGAQQSADGIEADIEAMAQMPGVSREAAQSLIDFNAAHVEVNATLAVSADQLAPRYAAAFGKEAPAALNKLKTALAELEGAPLGQAIAQFDALNRSTLNLAPAEASAIEQMLRLGDGTAAVTRILSDLAAQGGGHIDSVKTKIVQTEAELRAARDSLATVKQMSQEAFDPESADNYANAVERARSRVEGLEGQLRSLKATQAADDQAAFNDALLRSNSTLAGLHDNATRAKEAVAELHKEMETRRAATPNDPTVKDYFANQGKYDKKLEQQQDPGDFKTTKPRAEKGMGTEWADELRAQELAAVQAGQGSAQQLEQIEIAFWQSKVNDAKLGAQAHKQAIANLESVELSSAKQAAAQKAQIAKSDIDTDLAIQKTGIAARRAAVDADFQAGTLSAQQKHDLMSALLKEEIDDQIAAQEAIKALHPQDVAANAEADNQIRELRATLVADQVGLERQLTADIKTENDKRTEAAKKAAEEQAKAWRSANQEILGAERELISGIFSGRQSLGQILSTLALQTAEREITADLQYWTERRLLEAEGVTATIAAQMAGQNYHGILLAKDVAATAAGEAAKTGATVTGTAARTAAESTAAGTTRAIWSLTNQKQIFADAAKAASGTYSALAGIPVVGPIIAPPAAAAAFVAVEAFGNLASFDVGTNYVPRDQIARIHEGEAIIPKQFNPWGTGAGSGGLGGALHVNFGDFNVHGGPSGMSPSEFKKALSDHATHVAEAVHSAARGGWTSKVASPFKGS